MTTKETPLTRALLDEAFRVLQHDAGEHNEEYVYLRGELAKSFERVLRAHGERSKPRVSP
jgi:hypothetical protein